MLVGSLLAAGPWRPADNPRPNTNARTHNDCRWDCEEDGYDDDSNPLPKFKAAYEKFTAEIKKGRTAAWEA